MLDTRFGRSILNRVAKYKLINLLVKKLITKRGKTITPRGRKVIQEALPTEIFGVNDCNIQIGIVTRYRDAKFLPLCIKSLQVTHPELAGNIHIICPKADLDLMRGLVENTVTIHLDSDFVSDQVEMELKRIPEFRKGWIRQQVIKMSFAYHNFYPYSLLVDADTLILNHQKWIDNQNVQILSISDEYHEPYDKQFARYYTKNHKLDYTRMRVSFVTHHQLMQREVLNKLFASNHGSNFYSGVVEWLRALDRQESSGACEWHTYASFILRTSPKSVTLYKWLNLSVAPGNFNINHNKPTRSTIFEIQKTYPSLNSISLHHYLKTK